LEMKKMPMLDEAEVKAGFGGNVEVFTDKDKLREFLEKHYAAHDNMLLMSSGTFDGMNMEF
jgi:UDP-N-acetylmuramate: L-alanyl-gamma-D-glutamyl-meso-diaminopimelate ligase